METLLSLYDPDILCLSETKLSNDSQIYNEKIKIINKKYKYYFWNNCKVRKGYSGTCIISSKNPINVVYGLYDVDNNNIDDEGRVILLEFKKYYFIHVYTPNSGQVLSRLDWRINTWDTVFREYIKKLQNTKPVIICGDLNVAHKQIDIKNYKSNSRSPGFTIEERSSFDLLLKECDLVDIYRFKYPSKIEYTFWSYLRKSREKNIGWRLDYCLINNIIKNKIKDIKILVDIYGSDHAPILIIL